MTLGEKRGGKAIYGYEIVNESLEGPGFMLEKRRRFMEEGEEEDEEEGELEMRKMKKKRAEENNFSNSR